jgi:hypothetical protein
MEASPVSLTHRYTARPEPSVRNVFPDDEAVLITVEPDPLAPPLAGALLAGALLDPAAAAGELLAGAAELLLLPLAHAATSSPTPTAPPTPAASLAGADIRFIMEFLITFISRLARPVRASSHSPN